MIINVNKDSRGLYDFTKLREVTSNAFVAEIQDTLSKPKNKNVKSVKVRFDYAPTVYIDKTMFVTIYRFYGDRYPIHHMTFKKREFEELAGVYRD